jgi:hypothetical protein
VHVFRPRAANNASALSVHRGGGKCIAKLLLQTLRWPGRLALRARRASPAVARDSAELLEPNVRHRCDNL